MDLLPTIKETIFASFDLKYHVYHILDSVCNWDYSGFFPILFFYIPVPHCLGFPVWLFGSDSRESTCNAADPGLIPWSGRFPWRREWLPTPVFLPREFCGQKSLVGYSPWACKELYTTEQLTLFTTLF